MNWETLDADVNKILTKHFTSGRSGKTVNKVIIHYNAGNLTVEGCYSVWQSREASAHYQVESSGRIGQLVWDSDTAWHAGNWDANCTSIGIEHANNTDGTITDACLDAGAHLVAAICKKYNLGRPTWGKNLFGHSDFSATACPGPSLKVGGAQHDAYVAKAQAYYDQMTGSTSSSSSGTSTNTSTSTSGSLESYSGYVTAKINGLAYHSKPSWEDSTIAGTINKGTVLTVVGRIKVDGVYQYKTKAGWYITSASEYVTYSANTSTSTSASTSTKYKIGDHVIFSTCYVSSTDPNSKAIAASKMARNHGTITKIASGAKNPYLLDSGLCWVNDGDIRGYYK